MNTPDQGLSALEAIVSQATQQLFKEYPWLAAAYGEQMNRGGVLPEGKALETVLAERFNQFVTESNLEPAFELSLWDAGFSGEEGPASPTVRAQANVLAARVEHGILGEFPAEEDTPSGSYLDSSEPLPDSLKSALVGTLYVELLQQRFIEQWQQTTQVAVCPEGLLAAFRESVCARLMPQEAAIEGLSARHWFVENYSVPLLPALQALLPEGGYTPSTAIRTSADIWREEQLAKIVVESQQCVEGRPYVKATYRALLPDFIDKRETLVEAFKNARRGVAYEPQQFPRVPPIDPMEDRPLFSIAPTLKVLLALGSLNDSSVHLHGSFAVLQSQLTEHFSTVMGCRPDPRFSALLQLELYAHLLNNPNEEAQKSWCERQSALIYELYGNNGSLKSSFERWFKALAEARPELREAVSMILEYPLQSGSAKLSQHDCLSATPLFSERAVEQLTMHMSGDLGDGDNSTLSGTVPSPPHLQTAAISITHQGGVL
ncbi:hypothetical protein [unidentified bacterial endosymbiont]|uniref:hypothetical protein n=1 Tax=unidentified bacterial endosymbiont TaxID=2355 RepID=UPI0020A1410B|nr:hypothetical protein [unidentified bacterial endosymbiont]